MHVSIRRYQSDHVERVLEEVNRGFVPIISKAPGFVAYYVMHGGYGILVSVSVFETQEEAEASDLMAADWIARTIAPLFAGPPEITEGEVLVHASK
jgi:hypothetical protein